MRQDFLTWNKILYLLIIFSLTLIVDLAGWDKQIYYYLFCFLDPKNCFFNNYDLPFWDASITAGAVLAAIFAAENIWQLKEIEKAGHMPILRIVGGSITGVDGLSPVTVINIGKGIALQASLYICKGQYKELMDGMFDIGVSNTDTENSENIRTFDIGDSKRSAEILRMMHSDSDNEYKNMSLYLEYQNIFGDKFASELPAGNMQTSKDGSSLPNIIIPRSGWVFLGEIKK